MATKVKLNLRGFRELRNSIEVQRELESRAQRIAAAAGPGHEADVQAGRTRARAMVKTVTPAAAKAEATDRNLTRAIDAGRG